MHDSPSNVVLHDGVLKGTKSLIADANQAHDEPMRWRPGTALVAFLLFLTAACSGSGRRATSFDGRRVEILAGWKDVEALRFGKVLDRFRQLTGADVVYTSTNGRDTAA